MGMRPFVDHSERRSVEDGVRVQRVARFATLRSTPISPGLVMSARRCPADIVHLHFPHPPGELAWLLRGCRPPAVISYHAETAASATVAGVAVGQFFLVLAASEAWSFAGRRRQLAI